MPDKLKLTLVALLTSGVLQASDGDSYDPMEIDDASSSDAGQPITKFFAQKYEEESLEPLLKNTALEEIKIQYFTNKVRLPESLGDLHNLKKIEICETLNLCGPLPKSFTALQNLTYFDVSENNISETLPSDIGNLVNLTYLNFCFNKLEGEIPASLSKLTDLVHLDLSLNRIEGKIPDFLSNLTKLTYLSLGYNCFVGKIPEGLSALENLDHLRLTENKLSGQVPQGINLLKIRRFYIDDNPGLYGNIEDFLNQEQIEKQGLKKDLEYDFSETAFFGQLSQDILNKDILNKEGRIHIYSTFINQPRILEYVYNTFLCLKNTYDPKKEDFNDKARKALNSFYNQLDQDEQEHFVSKESFFEISKSFFNSYMKERIRAPNPRRP